MIRKFLYIIVILFAMSNIAFADEVSDILTSSTDYQTTSYGVCRKVKDGYIAQITGYDFINGITFCEIVPENNDELPIPKTINANTLYYEGSFNYRINEKQKTDDDGVLSAINKKVSEVKNSVASALGFSSGDFTVETISETDGMTLSAYLASLAVLKDIDAKDTKANVRVKFDYQTGQSNSEVVGQTAQGFNQSNIDYFKNLYNNLNEVYIHLQNLLFIVVGGFFLATLGGGKIQKYLENREQSTGNKEPYLHKFFIPLLCAGVFYMPITSGGGVNSTMIQKIIQYFTMEANHIADVASNIGSQAYVRKMAENININAKDLGEDLFKESTTYEKAKHIQKEAKSQIDNVCKQAYTDQRSFMDEEKYSYIEEAAKKEISGDDGFLAGFFKKAKKVIDDIFKPETDKRITKAACKQLTEAYYEASRTIDYIEESEKKHNEKLKENTSKQQNAVNNVRATLSKINQNIRENEKDFGWINSLIVPSSVLMFEVQSAYKAAATTTENKDFEALAQERDLAKADKRKDIKREDPMSDSNLNIISRFLTQNLLYLTLPGANTIRTMVDKFGVSEKTGEVDDGWTKKARKAMYYGLCGYTTLKLLESSDFSDSLVATSAAALGTYVVFKYICSSAGDEQGIASFFVSGIFTITFFKAVLEYLPTVIVCVSSILAFLSYFVTLCKYFYISPFVVAFALTTKRVDKILNFLVTGITIFFKPVLIVIFIYLALFLLHIVDEIFIMVSINQFNVLPSASIGNAIDYAANITTGIIQALLLFLASLSSIYIVWKTIMTGPDWVFKLLGLDNNSDNTIVQQMSSKLETKAIVV